MGERKSSILSQNLYVLKSGKDNEPEKKERASSILGHGKVSSDINGLEYVGGKLLSGLAGIGEGAYDLVAGEIITQKRTRAASFFNPLPRAAGDGVCNCFGSV